MRKMRKKTLDKLLKNNHLYWITYDWDWQRPLPSVLINLNITDRIEDNNYLAVTYTFNDKIEPFIVNKSEIYDMHIKKASFKEMNEKIKVWLKTFRYKNEIGKLLISDN